ncbi:MAG: 4Fe-4S binding protein [Alphaproteobacteria bacterium]|nr:4Fe-4S binding protein [Alphaproteobacteria bacterium]
MTPALADAPLRERLTPELVAELFPAADGIGTVAGEPPVATVRADGEIAGYLFSTLETVRPAGYAGNPFDIVVALGADGIIRDHRILAQKEPLLQRGVIEPPGFRSFLSELHGSDVRTTRRFVPSSIDGISGATVSGVAMANAMLDSALRIALIVGLREAGDEGLSLNRYDFAPATWQGLVDDGSVRDLRVGTATLYAALATPPAIGRNLFGERAYRSMREAASADDNQILVASVGGIGWIPENPWLVPLFERLSLVQGDKTFALRPEEFYRAWRLAVAEHPAFDEAGRFHIAADSGFDPLAPWHLALSMPDATVILPYRIPLQHVLGDDAALEDAGFKIPRYVAFGLWRESTLAPWQRAWLDKGPVLAGVAALLAAATAVMLFQHRLTRSRRGHQLVRLGVLTLTLVGLGWLAGAQLTILTVLSWLQVALGGLDWRALLMDAPLVLLSAYVLLTLVLWGRGVFCGWLCPFGALQELSNRIARLLRVPQVALREHWQARLWLVKYGVLAAVLGAALVSRETANTVAEVEPFKTAISLQFQRAWPYVAYAGALLAVGLIYERAFCRFLCPLGALLALAGRWHVFDWLKRRPECGAPCQICNTSCPVGAIPGSGRINMSECLQYLDCQVEYYDDRRCPPLAAERKRQEAMAAE